MTVIEDGVFVLCKSIESITIPESVSSIGKSQFVFCDNLESITVDENNEYYCSEDNIIFDKNKETLVYYLETKPDAAYTIPDSVTTIADGAFYGCEALTSVDIPDSVTSIGNGAFQECEALTSVQIPDSVTKIGELVFEGCSNVSVTYKGKTYTYENTEDIYRIINNQ